MTQSRLLPHPSLPPSDIGLNVEVREHLKVRFELTGLLKNYEIPAKRQNIQRMNNLWNETCLELFFGPEHQENYWELNFSPSGDWNLYSFDSYRKGMKEEARVQNVISQQTKNKNGLEFNLEIILNDLSLEDTSLNVGAAAVMKARNGEKSYWALKHVADKPDFHRRESFIVTMPFP